LVIRSTRERLLDAAYHIISEDSLSQLSIDRVTERAGLSRRTFFLHFTSKDALLAEVLDYLRPAEAEKWKQWRESLDPDLGVEDRIYSLFRHFVDSMDAPRWRGSCFVRISAEFADRVGHPVHAVVAAAHHDLEHWLAEELAQGDYAAPSLVAKQLVVLLNGLLITQLVHRDRAYSAAVLCMLPDILASGRSPDHALPQPAARLAVTG
jgi:AcrR family transcriptional regulator